MTDANAAPAGMPAVATDLSLRDLRAALKAGWADFRACPAYGVFFALIFVVSGLGLAFALIERGEIFWLILAAAGFPLLAPFTAVGLYEVSRRRENGLPIDWGKVLGALKGRATSRS